MTDGHTHKLIYRCRTYKDLRVSASKGAVNGMFLELYANIIANMAKILRSNQTYCDRVTYKTIAKLRLAQFR